MDNAQEQLPTFEKVADTIEKVSEAIRKIEESGLKKRAIAILLHHQLGKRITITDITEVLNGLSQMNREWLTKLPHTIIPNES